MTHRNPMCAIPVSTIWGWRAAGLYRRQSFGAHTWDPPSIPDVGIFTRLAQVE
jgi:hypothetical protein